MQTLNVGQNGGQSGSYVNPFAAPTAGAPSNTFNIQPPLLGELTGFDLGGDLDSDSDFLNLDDSMQRRNKLFKVHDDLSDGEIMPNIGVGDSLGEINPNQVSANKSGAQGRYGNSQASKPKKDVRPLAQTFDYEGGLESTYDHNQKST